jgi:PTH2 family peptidyl-tRNA hydrolase
MVNHFPKICLQVDTEQELIELEQKAKDAGLEAHIITDLGLTELDKPEKTCLAIGPDDSEKINVITGHLKLY